MSRILLIFVLLFSIIGSCQSEIVDRLAVVVNGEPITLSMLEDLMNPIQLDAGFPPKSLSEAFQKLIDHKLELQEARRLGITVSGEEISSEGSVIASRFKSKKEFNDALNQRGITQVDLEENVEEEIMIQKMIERKFRLFVKASDLEGEASDYFERNKSKFAVSESVQLERIFFRIDLDSDETAKENVKKKAMDAFDDLKAGAEFSKYTGEKRGEYVFVDRLTPIEAAAVARMKVGEISNLLETPVGYFIIKLNDRKPSRQANFDEVKEDVKAILIPQKTNTELEAWLKKQRAIADIRSNIQRENK